MQLEYVKIQRSRNISEICTIKQGLFAKDQDTLSCWINWSGNFRSAFSGAVRCNWCRTSIVSDCTTVLTAAPLSQEILQQFQLFLLVGKYQNACGVEVTKKLAMVSSQLVVKQKWTKKFPYIPLLVCWKRMSLNNNKTAPQRFFRD